MTDELSIFLAFRKEKLGRCSATHVILHQLPKCPIIRGLGKSLRLLSSQEGDGDSWSVYGLSGEGDWCSFQNEGKEDGNEEIERLRRRSEGI